MLGGGVGIPRAGADREVEAVASSTLRAPQLAHAVVVCHKLRQVAVVAADVCGTQQAPNLTRIHLLQQRPGVRLLRHAAGLQQECARHRRVAPEALVLGGAGVPRAALAADHGGGAGHLRDEVVQEGDAARVDPLAKGGGKDTVTVPRWEAQRARRLP